MTTMITQKTNTDLKELGYQLSLSEQYWFKGFGKFNAIFVDNDTREVEEWGWPPEEEKNLLIGGKG